MILYNTRFLLFAVLMFGCFFAYPQEQTIKNEQSPYAINIQGNNNTILNYIVIDSSKIEETDSNINCFGFNDNQFNILIIPFIDADQEFNYVYSSVLFQRLKYLIKRDSLNHGLCYLHNYKLKVLDVDSINDFMRFVNADFIIYGFYAADDHSSGLSINYCGSEKYPFKKDRFNLLSVKIPEFSNGTLQGEIDYILYSVAGTTILNSVYFNIYEETGLSTYDKDQIKKAIRYFHYVVDSTNINTTYRAKALSKLSYAYYLDKNFFQAKAYGDQALAIDSCYFELIGILGAIHIEEKNYEGAIINFTKALEYVNDSLSAILLYNRGIAYIELTHYDKAIEDFKTANQLRPNDDKTFINMGACFYAKGMYQESIDCYKQALELNPSNHNTYCNLGNTYLMSKMYNNALESYTNSLKINPYDALTYNNLGSLFLEIKKYHYAIECFSKAIQLDSSLYFAYLNKGQALFHTDFYQEAIEVINIFTDVYPDNFDAIRYRGMCYMNVGNFKESINDFTFLIEVTPHNSELLANRCLVSSHI